MSTPIIAVIMRFPFKLRTANDFDVVGFGTNAIDYLIRVPEYPAFNSKVELSEYSWEPGGEVASTMAGLQRLGLKTAYAGRFGGDEAGTTGLKSLIEEGVNVDYAETIIGAQTQVAFILIDERNGERTIIWQRDKRLAYSERDAPVDAATRGRILHLTPHDTRACIKLARSARENGVIVSVDADNIFDGIEELLSLTDICIGSADVLQKLLGIEDRRIALSEINARFGCAVAGLTLGESGSIFLADGSFTASPAIDVPGGCIDTTGAGDAFRTGFLFGLLTGENIEESARLANAVASLKCRGFGARSALPDIHELKMVLDSSNGPL